MFPFLSFNVTGVFFPLQGESGEKTEVLESSIHLWVEVLVHEFLTAFLPLLIRSDLVLRLRRNTSRREAEVDQVKTRSGSSSQLVSGMKLKLRTVHPS